MKKELHLRAINNFSLHYYLKDKSHSMNAIQLNKAEADFLKITEEISKILDYRVVVESKAKKEGGLESIFTFLSNSENLDYIHNIAMYFSGVLSSVLGNVISDKINQNGGNKKLEKEKLQLEIQKLKKELAENENVVVLQTEIDHELDDSVLEDKIYRVLTSKKIERYLSSFYKNIGLEKKVSQLSSQVLDLENRPIGKEKIVLRKDFQTFIKEDEVIEPLDVEQVKLEVVSPVLKNSRLSWKALYDGRVISFSVDDKYFKELILNKGLSFNNGTIIICDLEIKMKIDKNGDVKESTKTAYNVSKIIYPNGDIIDL